MLTREAILGAADLPEETVDVPEWGGVVRVRGLRAGERDAYEASLYRRDRGEVDLTLARAKLAALCMVGADGAPLFTLADAEALGEKSAAALGRVAEVARRLSGLDAAEKESARGN